MKLTPLTGIVIAIVILGVVAGVMAQVSTYVNSADLTSFGVYGGYIKGFVSGTPVIVFITLIYNVFMFVVRTQQAKLKAFVEMYDTTKLVITMTEFVAMIGPIFALAPSAEWKAVGSIASFVILVTANEISHIWKNLAPTSLQPVPSSPSEPEPTPTPTPSPGVYVTLTVKPKVADPGVGTSPYGATKWLKGEEVRITCDIHPSSPYIFDHWEDEVEMAYSFGQTFIMIANANYTFIAVVRKKV
jgi:hypothetical protein